MPIIIDEKFDSREATGGESPSLDLRFFIQGTDDDEVVRNLLAATAPLTYAGLVRQTVHVAPLGGDIWEGSARYGKFEPKQPGDSSFSFDTGGGTQHITQSVGTVNRYPANAPDFKGAVGVTNDSVDGTDITVPVYNFAETHYLADTAVTAAYKALLFSLTGKVNSAPFKGFSIGEVLFLGASGSKRGQDDWEISFRFAASPNVSGLMVGGIGPITKRGWDYLWVRYHDAIDQLSLVKQPKSVYVEQVYEFADLGTLGI